MKTAATGPVVVILSCVMGASLAWAQPTLPTPAPGPVGAGQLVQIILALGLVLALVVALGWGAQRLRLTKGNTGRHIKIVDTLALGARERLMLVEVDGERVLIGIASGRLERLHAMSAREPAGFAEALRVADAAQEQAP
jgi:flagellar protein FliO/FliZ